MQETSGQWLEWIEYGWRCKIWTKQVCSYKTWKAENVVMIYYIEGL